jgi:hypothetical protein
VAFVRRLLIGAMTICALAACGSSAAAPGGSASSSASSAGSGCGPVAARTLAASSAARVYVQSGAVYGCATGSRRRYLLGHTSFCNNSDRVGPMVVAGRMAGYAVTRCGVDTGSATVDVRRLSDGARVFSHAAASAIGPESYVSVTGIVATPGGGVAWIARASSIVGHRSATGVFARRGSGVRQLDAGAGIGPSSLRLEGARVSWQDGSARRSAPLR